MAERRSSVTYREADKDYFAKRTLRRHAGVWSLWALGVAAVISGDFFGWNFGLEFGFGGLLVATVVITVMYLGLCYSIAEMSPALPHTGGAYSFGRTAMGPWGGFVTGVAESIEYIVTPAVIVVGIGGYMNSIVDDLFGFTMPLPLWWAIFYGIFVGLNVIGVEASFRFSVFICLAALAILLVFWIGALDQARLPGAGDRLRRRAGSPTASRECSSRSRSRSGSTSRSRSYRWQRRSPTTRARTSLAARSTGCSPSSRPHS